MARLRDASVWKLKDSMVLHDIDGSHSQYADAAQCADPTSAAACRLVSRLHCGSAV